jgi:hypothetical protein
MIKKKERDKDCWLIFRDDYNLKYYENSYRQLITLYFVKKISSLIKGFYK